MLAYILRRLLLMIPTTIGVALVIFTLYHIAPGDPALIAVGSQSEADIGGASDNESQIDKFRREHGLDRNVIVQFLDYVGPFNFSANGHPWFSSPRTERSIEDVEVPGTGTADEPPRTVEQGRPMPIEHLYATTPEERERLDTFVGLLVSEDVDDATRTGAADDLVAFAGEASAQADKAHARLFQALYDLRLAGPNQEPGIRRVAGVLERTTGTAPALEPAIVERDGLRHELKRWFAWYYVDGGGGRTQNTGDKPYGGLLAFDLGEEMQSGQSVLEELGRRLKVTVPLSLVAVILSYLIALPLGIFSVRRQGTVADGGLTIVLFVLYSIPTFWAGLMLVLIFGKTQLDLLPIIGLHDKDADPTQPLAYAWDTVLHCILPIATLTYGSLAYLSRQMRAGMLDVIRQDYIRTAKAKGLSDDAVIYKHALRNSMIPVLTLLASILPILIGGSVIVEFIFDIPGMGKYAYEGLLRRDFYIVMATTIFVGIMTQFGILLSDIAYSLVDPRIRLH
ncbi:MAG: ABC transporter permease subunit [Planctomycetota bacterium]